MSAEITASCAAAGFGISSSDAWIAATAVAYQLPLLTHNPTDFASVEHLTIVTALPAN
jgi:tRNA(fMet)-specific endonuclease VapC